MPCLGRAPQPGTWVPWAVPVPAAPWGRGRGWPHPADGRINQFGALRAPQESGYIWSRRKWRGLRRQLESKGSLMVFHY